jgi:plasmid stability protein
MSVNLSIESVPDEIVARLRERAERNHRSLQQELMAIVAHAAAEPDLGPPSGATAAIGPRTAVEATGQPCGRVAIQRGTKPPEQVAADLRRIFPTPPAGLPNSMDIIREARANR